MVRKSLGGSAYVCFFTLVLRAFILAESNEASVPQMSIRRPLNELSGMDGENRELKIDADAMKKIARQSS